MSVNRNKRSIALDLATDAGKEVLRRLVKEADVFVENFRPGIADSLGAGHGTLRRINPRLVYCSISGFGQSGPRRDSPGYDIIALALSGMMSITGEGGRPPVKVGVPVSDIGAGMYAAFAIASALLRRAATGRGDYVDVSLFEGQLAWLTHQAGSYFATGDVPRRMGSAHAQIAPYQAFKAKDDYFVLAVGNDAHWRALCSVLPSSTLERNRKYSRNRDRVRRRSELEGELSSLFAKRTAAYWVRLISSAGVPVARINSLDAALLRPPNAGQEDGDTGPTSEGGEDRAARPPVQAFELRILNTEASSDPRPAHG